ncbi:formate--tetrahydrofolate ligase [bacterium]|nr:formate--tetrahydrofolate ligase [bacterium]
MNSRDQGNTMKSDIEIAQSVTMHPIVQIAEKIGLNRNDIELYGDYKAKIKLDVAERIKSHPDGKYIFVTAITPTPLGEGKTVVNIGLSQALGKIGKKVISTLREPSMGPVFGIKGGATGGGYSQVLPMEDINLHFTGDFHAITAAHNLMAAIIDNHLHKGNPLGFDVNNVFWNRVIDMNDRALRQIVVGLGGHNNGVPRQSSFDITAASEIMAILALAENFNDLRQRLERIFVGATHEKKGIRAASLKVVGALLALLKDAIKPNLVQTIEGVPCIMHTGPFANIATGNNSVIADKIALKLADYVVTECGFGADCGAEKLINIKCRQSGLRPSAGVVVATVKALKMHGGGFDAVPGKKIDKALLEKENVDAVAKGCENLQKHIENILGFGVPVVVAINKFTSDTENEIRAIREIATKTGAEAVIPIDVWGKGGVGGTELAEAVVAACQKPSSIRFTYDVNDSIESKLATVVQNIYGGKDIKLSKLAKLKIKIAKDEGMEHIPVCIAKTHLSLSHDPALKGRPKDFTVPIDDIRFSAGAGFLYAIAGEMMTMPGLPSVPSSELIDVDERGRVVGLF